MEIKTRLKAMRKALNLTQKEFSEKLGITQSFLSALELGNRDITGSVLKTLIVIFEVSTDWLITGKGSMFLYETKNGNEQKSEQIVQNSEILKKLK